MMRFVPTRSHRSVGDQYNPRLRVHIYAGADDELCVHDLVDASIEEALETARMLSEDDARLWSLALVCDSADPVLIWLSGGDHRKPPGDADEWRRRAQMQDRYLMARSLRDEQVLLPNGLRAVSMFPEWMVRLPLWERFGDSYPVERGELPISGALEQDLIEWSREWESYGIHEDRPPAWFERGWKLHERLQQELAGIAEVRPQFAY